MSIFRSVFILHIFALHVKLFLLVSIQYTYRDIESVRGVGWLEGAERGEERVLALIHTAMRRRSGVGMRAGSPPRFSPWA